MINDLTASEHQYSERGGEALDQLGSCREVVHVATKLIGLLYQLKEQRLVFKEFL